MIDACLSAVKTLLLQYTVCLSLFPRDSRFRCSRTSRSASGGSERHNQHGPRANIQPPLNSIFSTELFNFIYRSFDLKIVIYCTFISSFFVFTFIKHIYRIFNCLNNFEYKFHSYRIKFYQTKI